MEGDEVKGASGALEISNQGTMLAPPRIRVRSDLFSENRNIHVVQHMNLKHQLESLEGTDSEEEVKIVNVVEGHVAEEGEMKGALEKIVFGGLLPKAPRRLKPARKGISERFMIHHYI